VSYVVSQITKTCIRCKRKAAILADKERGYYLIVWQGTETRPVDIDEVPSLEMVFDSNRGDGYCK
jgi:hypothetical protein